MISKFLENKYTRWYFRIINNPDTTGYVERHHIIPRCMGGDNSLQNIVRLSARQHFVCHLLLTKMIDCPLFRGKMHYALRCMLIWRTPDGQRYIPKCSRIFEKVRRAHKGISRSIETRKKISEAKKGVLRGPLSPETRKKIGDAHRGRSISENQRKKISTSLQGKSTWMKGHKHTKESLEKMSLSQKSRKRKPASKHSVQAVENNRQGQLKFNYTVQSPTGELFVFTNMKTFCAIHDLPYQRLADKSLIGKPIKDSGHIKNKSHVGWVVINVLPREVEKRRQFVVRISR